MRSVVVVCLLYSLVSVSSLKPLRYKRAFVNKNGAYKSVDRVLSLSLRGGSSPGSGGGGDDFVSSIGPLWSMLSKVVADQVEPMLKDPNGKILLPAQSFLQHRAKEVQARQMEHSANPQSALKFVLKPLKLARLSVTALVVAEALNYFGVLEDPELAKEKIRQAFREARMEFHELRGDLRGSAQSWWKSARSPGGILHGSTWKSPASLKRKIAAMEPKHQFAFGATVGFALSPFCWCVATQLIQSAAAVYLTSEANHILKTSSGKSAMDRIGDMVQGNLGDSLETGLETVRSFVRRTMSNPATLLESIPESLDRFVPQDGLTPNTKRGLLLGLVVGVAVV